MPHHSVSISQLVSDHGNAFLNVIEDKDAFGAIGVWGSLYQKPTYLIQDGIQFILIQFNDEACAKEWLEEHPKKAAKAIKLEDTK